jgi:hypothetical protein
MCCVVWSRMYAGFECGFPIQVEKINFYVLSNELLQFSGYNEKCVSVRQ